MEKVLVLHGPNLNLLGVREPGLYGETNLEKVNQEIMALGKTLGIEVVAFQSNHEGQLIDKLHEANSWSCGVVFNPAGFAHTSVALRDAVAAISIPVIEVHISNVLAREDFRHQSLIAPVCAGMISGFGWKSYLLGLQALHLICNSKDHE